MFSRLFSTLPLALWLAAVGPALAATGDVLTQHNDNFRTGLADTETVLTPATVNVTAFGRLFTQPVDGEIYAQPLVLSGVAVPGKGTHRVVFVATEHDSVYAFDADDAVEQNAEPLWHRSFINPARGITSVPYEDLGSEDIAPEIGITGTPVIDASTGTLFCVAKTKESGRYFQRLHALDVRTGAERPGSPKLIAASVAGTGDGAIGGRVAFDPRRENQRAGLLLLRGVVYIAWASHGDNGPYHGWILGYHARTLAQVGVFNDTPDGGLGGIWQSGTGLSAYEDGHIFCSTGNGTFDLTAGQHTGTGYGDAVLKLATSASGALSLADFFAPTDSEARNEQDADLGSSGVVLLPAIPGTTKRLAVLSGKAVATETGTFGHLYLLDRDDLGGFSTTGDRVVQRLDGQIKSGFGAPAFFNDTLYFHGTGQDVLKAFDLSTGLLSATPVALADLAQPFGFPGATPSISANGTTDGIVWEIEHRQPAFLHAYEAANLANQLYHSDLAPGTADAPGNGVKFTTPTIAHGKVYVGCVNQFSVFGLRDDAQPPLTRFLSPAEGARTTAATPTFTGTVSDPTGVEKLEFSVENADGVGTFQNVPLERVRAADRWTFDAPLIPGVNTIRLRATDRFGNVSTSARTVTFVKFGALTVSIDPPASGRVTSGFAGTTTHQLGVPTTLTATANPGFAFDHWTGIASSAAVLNFLPQENQTLVAGFVASPFLAVTGTFHGAATSSDPAQNGLVTFTLTGTGAFTASATVGGLTFTGKGIFQTDGSATVTLVRPGAALPLTLQLDLTGSEQITGSLGSAALTANRAIFTAANVSGLRGFYTLSLAPEAVAATPRGAGYATARVDDPGRVRVAGVLADGTPFSQGSWLSETKKWPLSIPLYARLGVLAGEVTCSGTAPVGLSGTLLWQKPPRPADRLFPGGFTAHPTIVGSSYDPLLAPNLLGLPDTASNAQLILAGGAPIFATLRKTNAVAFAGASPPVLAITPATGLIRGSFLRAGATVRTPFNGVVVQAGSFAAGYFPDGPESRPIRFEAKP